MHYLLFNAGVAWPQRDQRDRQRQLPTECAQVNQGGFRHQEARRRPLPIPCPWGCRGQEEGTSHWPRKEEGYQGRQVRLSAYIPQIIILEVHTYYWLRGHRVTWSAQQFRGDMSTVRSRRWTAGLCIQGAANPFSRFDLIILKTSPGIRT